jgi:hypothetical protein
VSEFRKVSTTADLANLDGDEILAGYLAGYKGEPEPGSDKSRSFWHGWRNGMADAGRVKIDAEQRALVAAIIRRQRAS